MEKYEKRRRGKKRGGSEGRRGLRLLIGVIRRQGHGLRTGLPEEKFVRRPAVKRSRAASLDKIVDLCLHTRFT